MVLHADMADSEVDSVATAIEYVLVGQMSGIVSIFVSHPFGALLRCFVRTLT